MKRLLENNTKIFCKGGEKEMSRQLKKWIKELSEEQITDNSSWLDKDTWINWGINIPQIVLKAISTWFEIDTEDNDTIPYLCIEYWNDTKEVKLLLQNDYGSYNLERLPKLSREAKRIKQIIENFIGKEVR